MKKENSIKEPIADTASVLKGPPLGSVEAKAYRIPTDAPESDGTLQWESTILVVVHVRAGDQVGLGYTYADKAAAELISGKLGPAVTGCDALAVTAAWERMTGAVRNLGRSGISAMAISAVDCALWDLKAKLLKLPLVSLLGQVRSAVPVYGSGGFTSYDETTLCDQLAGWVEQGIPRVKMKVGRNPRADRARVAAARRAIGESSELFVDANGAYARKQALTMAGAFAIESGVNWLEEPVSSDDLEGLRLLRDRAPAGLDITAGEYGFYLPYFRRMLEAGAVDCIQPDVTRCCGITGFLKVAALGEAHFIPLSAHCAPAQSLHVCCAVRPLRHIEYFHDHVRIEQMLFDGVPQPVGGALRPNLSLPGMGLEFREADARRFVL